VKAPAWLPTAIILIGCVAVWLIRPSVPADHPAISTELTAAEVRLRAIEKRIIDLEFAMSDISFRMRLERRVNDEQSQRRVDEMVARANIARDAGRGIDEKIRMEPSLRLVRYVWRS
jgi:hypothetical protein